MLPLIVLIDFFVITFWRKLKLTLKIAGGECIIILYEGEIELECC